MGIQTGDKAPEFTLPKADGSQFKLSDALKRGPVVLYFYPKDETRGCTAEACSFRDAYEDFKAAGAEVVGVSSDSEESHQSFAKHHRLPFTLLSDRSSEVRKQYGVPKSLGLIPGRVSYLIDHSGTVRHVFNSQVQAVRHVAEALQVIKGFQSGAGASPA
jgi:peroxiredoxin Q/BCP